MADLMRTGQEWLTEQLNKHVSTEVQYRRGTEQITVKATIGRTLLKLDDGYGGVRMEWTDRDFLIRASDLVLNGSQTTPVVADQIRETFGTGVNVFEVRAPGNEPHWRWSDPHQTMLRIHSKQIGTE